MWFVDVLLNIWAYLPVFALTDDVGFLTSRHGSEQSHRYYFSLISILFGEKKIQLISFPIKQPGEKIILFRIKCVLPGILTLVLKKWLIYAINGKFYSILCRVN